MKKLKQQILEDTNIKNRILKEFDEKWDIIPPTKEGAMAFISDAIDSVLDEVEKRLPKEKKKNKVFDDISIMAKTGFNDCLAQVKEGIKIMREK